MKSSSYNIRPFYQIRSEFPPFSDVGYKDDWQLEIYLHALGYMVKHGYTRVLDVGCGAGFKLLTYLGQYETTGLEVGDTLTWLKENHPDRNWQESDFSRGAEFSADVVICSDVIEHLTEPDKLLKFLGEMAFKHLIISTPCRNILYHPWHRGFWGPPANECHAREWSF